MSVHKKQNTCQCVLEIWKMNKGSELGFALIWVFGGGGVILGNMAQRMSDKTLFIWS